MGGTVWVGLWVKGGWRKRMTTGHEPLARKRETTFYEPYTPHRFTTAAERAQRPPGRVDL